MTESEVIKNKKVKIVRHPAQQSIVNIPGSLRLLKIIRFKKYKLDYHYKSQDFLSTACKINRNSRWHLKKLILKTRGCLVCVFKQPFSVFKQHFTHFNALFHPHVFPQIFSNNNFQFLNTCTKRALEPINHISQVWETSQFLLMLKIQSLYNL